MATASGGLVSSMLWASGMTTLGAVPVFLLSTQAVSVREELGFGDVAFGVAVSSFFASAALTALLASLVLDAWGRRWSTVVAGLTAAFAGTGTAVLVSSYLGLVLAMVALGSANALLQLTSNLTLARRAPTHRRGLAFGVKQSAVPLAVLVGGLAAATVGTAVGWRWTFAASGVAGMLVTVLGLRIRDRGAAQKLEGGPRDRPPTGALALTAVAMGVASASVNALTGFLPSWAHVVGLTLAQAGLLAAVGGGAAIVMRVLSGLRADRRHGRNFPVVVWQLLGGAVGLTLLAVDGVPTLVLGAMLAFGVGWAWPGLLLFAVVRIGRDAPGAAAGTLQAAAFAGGAGGPMLFGMLVAAFGYPVAWLAGAGALTFAAILLVVARAGFRADLRSRPLKQAG